MTDDDTRADGVRTPGHLDTAQDDPDARVDQLTSEIGDTRDDLTQTLEAIGDKLDPANIAREASETVKGATIGKVEQMTYGAQETWRDVRTGNSGNIVDTITSNPIPAGMVAVGLGLLFMNRGQSHRSGDAGRGFSADAQSFGRGRSSWESSQWDRRSQNGGGSPADKVGELAGQAGQKAGEVADQAGQKAGEVFGNVGQAAEQLPQQAGYYVERGGSQARRLIDEYPLGAGMIAVAAGAAIGMLLPTTSIERETIGSMRDDVVEKAESTVHQALDRVEEQVESTESQAATV
jgi:ElaB/YqjD/DUF883 family membrane-anchored ribosome-binding protein